MSKNNAFTLAEILITLSVIGIIAVIAVPGIIQKYKNTLNIVRLKKYYGKISNSIQETLIINNCQNINCIYSNTNTPINSTFNSTTVLNKLRVFIPDIMNDSNHKCSPQKTYSLTGTELIEKYGDGYSKGKYYYCLKDGTGIAIWDISFSTNTQWTVRCDRDNSTCATLFLYTGGGKQKAILGKNVFIFNLDRQGNIRVPSYPTYKCQKSEIGDNSTNVNGTGCFDYLLKHNWKMNY